MSNMINKQSKRWTWILLILTLLGAFGLRFRGISFGLPLTVNNDEVIIMRQVRGMLDHGDPNPHFFNYPSLYLYMQAGVCKLTEWYGSLTNSYNGLEEAGITRIYLAGRFLTLLMSVGTILGVFWTGKVLLDERTGLLAALILSVCVLHTANSVYITVDSPMTLWVVLSFLASACLFVRGPKWKYYLWGAILAGLAIGSKYTGFLAGAPLFFAHWRAHQFSLKALWDRKLIVAGVVAALVFLMTTPFALLDYRNFYQGLHYEARHYMKGHLGAAAETVSYGNYAGLLAEGFGPLSLAAALGGLAYLTVEDRRKGIFLWLYPVLFFLFIGRYRAYFSRNLLSLTPFLALAAGYPAVRGWDRLRALRLNRGEKRRVLMATAWWPAVLLVAGGLVQQGLYGWNYIGETLLTDTRLAAAEWIQKNIPARSRIATESYTPPPDRKQFLVKPFGLAGLAKHEPQLGAFDYLIASSYNSDRLYQDPVKYDHLIKEYARIFALYRPVYEIKPDGVRYTGPVITIYRVKE